MKDRNIKILNTMSTFKGAHCIALLMMLILLAALMYAGKNYVIFKVSEHFTGQVVYTRPLKVGDRFTLTYIHSVTKQRVDEVFRVDNRNVLSMVEMRYDSFGANLPVGSERLAAETTSFTVEEGYYKITYENRKMELIPLMVGQVVADHTIVFGDSQRVRLLDVVSGGAYVDIYVEPIIFK